MKMYIILFVFSVFISSISQTMLKSSANKEHSSGWKEYLNPVVIIAYMLFLFSTILTTLSYKNVPLSMGGIIEASGYFFVAILGYFFLKEKLSKRKIFGLCVILFGILVFNL